VSGNYVVNGTNLYQEITATCTSAGSGGPTGTGSNIADNTCHWNYMNPSYYAQKTGFFNSCTTGSASPNASWCSAEDYVVGPSDTGWFHINKELDMTNSTGRAPSSTNILNTLSLSGNIGAYPITADINFFHPANGSSFAALNGLMFAGGFMYQNSTIADATTNGVLGIDLSSAAYSSALAMKIGNTYNIGWLNSSAQFTLGSHGALIGNANINETVLDNYDTGTFIFRGSGFSTVAEISPSALLFEGHVSSIGGPPIVSSCGTGPLTSVDFNDTHGTITEGTTATGCTITFKDVHNNAPDCVISFQTQLPAALTYSTSTTALTVSNTSATGDKFSYVCMGN
jgi:hypothetical protein